MPGKRRTVLVGPVDADLQCTPKLAKVLSIAKRLLMADIQAEPHYVNQVGLHHAHVLRGHTDGWVRARVALGRRPCRKLEPSRRLNSCKQSIQRAQSSSLMIRTTNQAKRTAKLARLTRMLLVPAFPGLSFSLSFRFSSSSLQAWAGGCARLSGCGVHRRNEKVAVMWRQNVCVSTQQSRAGPATRGAALNVTFDAKLSKDLLTRECTAAKPGAASLQWASGSKQLPGHGCNQPPLTAPHQCAAF